MCTEDTMNTLHQTLEHLGWHDLALSAPRSLPPPPEQAEQAAGMKDVLQLTWWPLARDSTYYTFSLSILAIFFGVVGNKPESEYVRITVHGKQHCFDATKDWTALKTSLAADPAQKGIDINGCLDCAAIYHWEAAILFVLYFGYCTVMK